GHALEHLHGAVLLERKPLALERRAHLAEIRARLDEAAQKLGAFEHLVHRDASPVTDAAAALAADGRGQDEVAAELVHALYRQADLGRQELELLLVRSALLLAL